MKILVLGNYRQTITIVRALARAGNTIVLGTPRVPPFTRFSNCVDEVWQHSPEIYEKCYQSQLESYLRAESKLNPIVVFPVGETQLRCLANLPVQAQSLAAWAMPAPEIVRGCLDKTKANHIATKVGVSVPLTRHINTKAALLDAARELGFPLVCKLKDSSRLLGGKKAWVCWSPDNLTRVLAAPEMAEGLQILVQKRIPGPRMNCHFSAYDGKMGAYFQQKILRTTAADESGDGVESISAEPDPALRAQVEAIAKAFHYTGVGCAQFIIEEGTGKPWFLELNPRLDAGCALPYFCGIDFPKLAIQIATSGPGNEPPEAYPVGVKITWFYGDFFGVLQALKSEEIGLLQALHWVQKALGAFLTTKRHLTWDWRDPVPTLYLYLVATPIAVCRAALYAVGRIPISRSAHPEDPLSRESAPSVPDRRTPPDQR